jgi:hypothetical protein
MAAAALALVPHLDIARANQHMRCMYMQAGSKLESSDESSRNISKEYIIFDTNCLMKLQICKPRSNLFNNYMGRYR